MSSPVDAKLNLNKQIPGGSDPARDGEDIYQGFSVADALVRIGQISSALHSFTKLTDLSRSTMSRDELKNIGNTEGDIQNIGFDNWIGSIEGTILKQEYEIKQLKYQLAQERYKSRGISKEALDKAKKEFEDGERSFQAFWDKFNILD